MTSSLPRIAIPEPTSTDEAYNQRSLPQYIRAVEAAGGIAVPIPLHESPTAQESLLASCSAILLPGSPADVDPARYGQEAQKECAARDPAREAADDLLLRDAFDQAKPILGICYGLQSLNVWQRGTLIQDLPHGDLAHAEAGNGSSVNHQPGRQVQEAHPVRVTPGSRLSRVLSEIPQEEHVALCKFESSSGDRPSRRLARNCRHQSGGWSDRSVRRRRANAVCRRGAMAP